MEHGGFSTAYATEENDSHSLKNHELPVAPQLQVEHHEPPWWPMTECWQAPSSVDLIDNHCCCGVNVNAMPRVQCFTASPLSSSSCLLSVPSSEKSSETWSVCHRCPIESWTLNRCLSPALWQILTSTLPTTCCMKKLLWLTRKESLIFSYKQKCIRNLDNMFIYHNSSNSFP